MPQISLYIDEDTLRKVEAQAKTEHLSISKWVFEQIKGKIAPQYPLDYKDLYGSLSNDFTRPEQVHYDFDSKREQL